MWFQWEKWSSTIRATSRNLPVPSCSAEEFVAATKDGLIVYDASQIDETDKGGRCRLFFWVSGCRVGVRTVRHKPQPPSSLLRSPASQCHEAMAEQLGQRSCRVWGTRSTVGDEIGWKNVQLRYVFFSLQESLILLVIFSCFINVSLTSPSHTPWPVAGPRLKLSPLALSDISHFGEWGNKEQPRKHRISQRKQLDNTTSSFFERIWEITQRFFDDDISNIWMRCTRK